MKSIIKSHFMRQICNLQSFMNAYSMTLREEILTEQEFSELYDLVCKYKDKFNLKYSKEEHDK